MAQHGTGGHCKTQQITARHCGVQQGTVCQSETQFGTISSSQSVKGRPSVGHIMLKISTRTSLATPVPTANRARVWLPHRGNWEGGPPQQWLMITVSHVHICSAQWPLVGHILGVMVWHQIRWAPQCRRFQLEPMHSKIISKIGPRLSLVCWPETHLYYVLGNSGLCLCILGQGILL